FGVSTGVLFFLGLGITTCGILLARSESQFAWFPRELQATMARFLQNSQAVLVGAAVTLVGAVVVGLAARRMPERTALTVLALARPLYRSATRRDLVLAIGALALAAGCTGLLYQHLVPAG